MLWHTHILYVCTFCMYVVHTYKMYIHTKCVTIFGWVFVCTYILCTYKHSAATYTYVDDIADLNIPWILRGCAKSLCTKVMPAKMHLHTKLNGVVSYVRSQWLNLYSAISLPTNNLLSILTLAALCVAVSIPCLYSSWLVVSIFVQQ